MPIKVTLAPGSIGSGLSRPLAGEASPRMVVGLLLLICYARGLCSTIGVVVPPDPDTVRDLGFIQGLLDGNLLGDPAIAGAWRWYPPLLHVLAALFIGGLHLPLLPVWLHAGAFLNLLTPLTFYGMNRRLIGAWPGAAATAVMVLFDSATMPGDAAAGYTPWTLTPALAWPLFFGSVWLIAHRIQRLRTIDAALIGAALGLVFLAHTVPAVLLSCITVCAAVAVGGWRRRTLVWLATVATIQLVSAMPLLLPLLLAYHLQITNSVPGGWVHPALTDPWTLLPNFAGLLSLAWLLYRGEWSRQPRVTTAILGGWILVCVVFLGRHYACSLMGETGGACGVFIVAAHHYHVYLQAAWATIGGLALVRLWQISRPHVLTKPAIGVILIALVASFGNAEDLELSRLGGTRAASVLDRQAYDWIITQTDPAALFVTELPAEGVDMGPAAASVMAAGRRLVSPPEFHTNPYVSWLPLNKRRIAYLAAAAGTGSELCDLLRQEGEAAVYFLLSNEREIHETMPMFRGRDHTIYHVEAAACHISGPRDAGS